jgi:RHS repeat-associated protein
MLAAAKEAMALSPLPPPGVLFPLVAFEGVGKNSRPGFGRTHHTLHQGFEWVNSTTALGIEPVLLQSGVRSRCTGKERDGESGLDFFGARYYANSTGRFLTVDPVSLTFPPPSIEDPQHLNSYSNARNNPLNYVDLDGNFSGPTHEMITYEVARSLGYGAGAIRVLNEGNLHIDRLSNFLNNAEHGLTDSFTRVEDILRVTANRLNSAVQEALEGQYVGAAWQLGQGLHTVQDLVAHEGKNLRDHGVSEDQKINDRDPHKVTNAFLQSKEYLKRFEAAITKAVGKRRASKIIAAVKKANNKTQRSNSKNPPRGSTQDVFLQGDGGRCGMKTCEAYLP